MIFLVFIIQSILLSFIGGQTLKNTHLKDNFFIHKIVGFVQVFVPLYLFCYSFRISSFFPYLIILLSFMGLTFFYRKNIQFNILEFLKVELIFLVSVAFILIFYMFGPALNYGEKPMDLSFLSYFLKFPSLPAMDPWLFDKELNYYDFGFFLYGTILGYVKASLETKYYLSLSITAGLSFLTFASVLSFVKGKSLTHFLASFLVLLLCPFSIISYFYNNVSPSLFWNFTRIFPEGLFLEFPLWSFLFSDLHPHVMMIPFNIVAVFSMYLAISYPQRREYIFLMFLSAFSILLGNTWDFLWTAVFFIPLSLFFLSKNNQLLKNKDFYTGLGICIILSLGLLISGKFTGTEGSRFFQLSAFSFGIIGFIKSFALPFILMSLASLILYKGHKKFIFTFLLTGIWSLGILSTVIFNDRLNTVFKGGTYLWIFLVLSSFTIIYKKLNFKKILPIYLYSGFGIFIVIHSWLSFGFKDQAFSLSKLEKRFNDSDKNLLFFFQEKGSDYSILTPYLKTYDYKGFEKISFWGVPLVMGWDNHLYVRGKNWILLKERERDIENFYKAPNAESLNFMFQKYKMSGVYFPEGVRNIFGELPNYKVHFDLVIEPILNN